MKTPLKWIIGAGSVVLAAGLIVWVAASKDGSTPNPAVSSLPRYALTVGQELIYEGAMTSKFSGGAFHYADRTELWIVRQNAGGGWHIVAHGKLTMTRTNDRGETRPEHGEDVLDSFELFPDGRVAGLHDDVRGQRLLAPFFRLPADAAAGQHGWAADEAGGEKSIFRFLPLTLFDAGVSVIEKTDTSLLNDVYLATSKAVGRFDHSRGLFVEINSEYSQGWGGFAGTGSGTSKLKSLTTRSPAWIEQLARESEQFIRTRQTVGDTLAAIRKSPQPAATIATAEQALLAGQKACTLPLVSEQFATQLTQLRDSAKYYLEDNQSQAAVLNQPSPAWETTDLDGAKHSLAGYRGKVVVLDFWYRGCGWCIRAMPQIKEVAEHFRGRPVAVLGMNTDRVEEDARFVMKKLALNYPTLKAIGLPEKYGVHGFPTLLVIDQRGMIREFHVGYSPTLREHLIKTIDGLLADGS